MQLKVENHLSKSSLQFSFPVKDLLCYPMEANSLCQQLQSNSFQVQERDQTELVSLGPSLTLPGSACGQEVGQVVEHG